MRFLFPLIAFFAKCRAEYSSSTNTTSTDGNSTDITFEDVVLARGDGLPHGNRPNIIPVDKTMEDEFIVLADGSFVDNPNYGLLNG